MRPDLFYIQSAPGHVIEIYKFYGHHYFLTGFCRGVIYSEAHVHFVDGFDRVSDPDLRNCRAVLRDWDCVPFKETTLGVVQEQPWMRVTKRPESGD